MGLVTGIHSGGSAVPSEKLEHTHQKGVQVSEMKTGQADVMDVTDGQYTLKLVFP